MEHNCQIEMKQVGVKPPVFAAEQQGPSILKDINLSIHRGEWITLLGRNGSGKSTLAKAAAGYRLAGLAGQIARSIETWIPGRPLPLVMQQPEASMIGATPLEDVVLMLEQNEWDAGSIIEKAEEGLRSAGLGERMHQPIETLSGGQKQLVAIAGCLAMQSPLLVLDEITSMLDPEAADEVLSQVRALHQNGVTVIWITQRLDELAEGDRIVVMQDGGILYDGTAEGWFVRKDKEAESSRCELYGFEAPYAVQVAWELEKLGVRLGPLPYTAAMLAKAVNRHER